DLRVVHALEQPAQPADLLLDRRPKLLGHVDVAPLNRHVHARAAIVARCGTQCKSVPAQRTRSETRRSTIERASCSAVGAGSRANRARARATASGRTQCSASSRSTTTGGISNDAASGNITSSFGPYGSRLERCPRR